MQILKFTITLTSQAIMQNTSACTRPIFVRNIIPNAKPIKARYSTVATELRGSLCKNLMASLDQK
jgi:hypothetical protein